MQKKESKISVSLIAMGVVVILIIAMAFMTNAESVQQTAWSLVPPIIAIALALITKEVYSSLFIGIITGALLYSGYSFEGTLTHIFNDGVVAVLSDSYNVGILVFLVILGIMVQLMNRTGGSAAFGNWASEKITTREGAQLATIGLGCLIFIDDYFNCLTVGSVMRPVTDKHCSSCLHHRSDLLLGRCGLRFRRGRERHRTVHQVHPLQLLRAVHHRHDDPHGHDENRVRPDVQTRVQRH